MTHKNIKLMPKLSHNDKEGPHRLTYWRSSNNCFSIDYKGIITEICEGDLGYGDMNRMDGAIHAAIGCKQSNNQICSLKKV